MRTKLLISVVLTLLMVTLISLPTLEARVRSEKKASTQTLVQREAPEFEAMAYQQGKFTRISLSDYRGKWVILFFYPLAFTFVCPTEIQEMAEHYSEITDLDAEVLAISVDSVYVHKAWYETDARLEKVTFPVLSDSSHEIGISYGVMNKALSNHLRATFIIDPEGIVRHQAIYEEETGRSIAEIIRVLQALQTGALCPVEWEPGEPVIEMPTK